MTEQEKIKYIKRRNKRMKRAKTRKKRRRILGVTIGVIAALYLTFVFCPLPFIARWRTVYIETAMTTNSHKWLATMFIPHYIIDKVMDEKKAQEAYQKKLKSKWDTAEVGADAGTAKTDEEAFFDKYWELDSESFRDYLKRESVFLSDGYNNLLIDNMYSNLPIYTVEGDRILAVDAANNTIIIGVKGEGYSGKLAIVKNINQVSVKNSAYLGSRGETCGVYAKRYDAEVTINASAFRDVGGHGSGGLIRGACVENGREIGTPERGYWKFVGVRSDGKMYVSNYYSTDISDYRWGLEFYPALIVDGKNVVDGTFGMGIQPRTAIGQNSAGDFMMLIIDGRQVGYSLGCTVSDCEKILSRYKAYQAINLDGGSSAIMCYKGKQITKPSSVSSLGRFLPNAIVVSKAG